MRNKLFHHNWFISMVLIIPLFLGAKVSVDLDNIKNNLICTCECNMTVEACEVSMTCSTSKKLIIEAKRLIKKGLNEKKILNTFSKRYGEQILSAPVKEGFNLIAWILPFTIFFLTGLGIVIMLRNWTKQLPVNSVNKKDNPENIEPKYEEQLNKALDNLD